MAKEFLILNCNLKFLELKNEKPIFVLFIEQKPKEFCRLRPKNRRNKKGY